MGKYSELIASYVSSLYDVRVEVQFMETYHEYYITISKDDYSWGTLKKEAELDKNFELEMRLLSLKIMEWWKSKIRN